MRRIRVAITTLALTAAGFGLFVAVGAKPPGADGAKPAPGPVATATIDLDARAIDLTHPFGADTIYWPTDPSFRWEKRAWGRSSGGYWYASATYGASEHGGTHLDSPIHFGEGQATADQIPLSRLIGPAVVVDVACACERDRDYRLRVDDLVAWESAHGRIPDGAIVLVRTGWGRSWPDKAQLSRQRHAGRYRPPPLPRHLARGGRVARPPTQGRRRGHRHGEPRSWAVARLHRPPGPQRRRDLRPRERRQPRPAPRVGCHPDRATR